MTGEGEPDRADLLIDLNFVPAWARNPPTVNPYRRQGEREGAVREPGRRSDRSGPPGARRADASRPVRERRGPQKPEGRTPASDMARETPPTPVGLEIMFLPERRGLAPLAHRMAQSARAYALFEVAALFLSKPEYYAVRVAVAAQGPAPRSLWQCRECWAIFLEGERAKRHAFERHFESFCRRETIEIEPPKGNFVCVARCGLSGELLGPPNYHGFSERVAEVHRRRFAHLTIEQYRQHVENVHDPALVEQWRESMRRQARYHFGPPEAPVVFQRFTDAEVYFREQCASRIVREGTHFVMPGPVSCELEDADLRRLIREAWQRESRFPLRLSIALRLAFRHHRLHTFKTANGATYLTAVLPSPLDPTHAVPVVRTVLEHIGTHPGCTRQELVQALVPDAGGAPEAPAAAEIVRTLNWLVAKGHVIEFADGHCAVPAAAVTRVLAAKPSSRRSIRKQE